MRSAKSYRPGLPFSRPAFRSASAAVTKTAGGSRNTREALSRYQPDFIRFTWRDRFFLIRCRFLRVFAFKVSPNVLLPTGDLPHQRLV
jgi:hypothetical protein